MGLPCRARQAGAHCTASLRRSSRRCGGATRQSPVRATLRPSNAARPDTPVYRVSVLQAEFLLTQVFDRPLQGSEWNSHGGVRVHSASRCGATSMAAIEDLTSSPKLTMIEKCDIRAARGSAFSTSSTSYRHTPSISKLFSVQVLFFVTNDRQKSVLPWIVIRASSNVG